MFESFRKKSLSELSLVLDIIRGGSSKENVVDEQHRHPERVSASTGNLTKTGRRNILRWKTMSPNYIQKQFNIGEGSEWLRQEPFGM